MFMANHNLPLTVDYIRQTCWLFMIQLSMHILLITQLCGIVVIWFDMQFRRKNITVREIWLNVCNDFTQIFMMLCFVDLLLVRMGLGDVETRLYGENYGCLCL